MTAALRLAPLLLAVLALIAPAPQGVAAAASVTVVNSLGISLPVEVDGAPSILREGASVLPAGSTLCIVDDVIYTGPGRRLVFEGWIVNGILEPSRCVELEPGSVAEPSYAEEFLVRVVSEPEGVYEAYAWGRRGSLVEFTVPLEIEGDEARYRLAGVSGDAELRGDRLVVPVYSSIEVRVRYHAEYRVTVLLSLYGLEDRHYWLPAFRESLVIIPSVVDVEEGVRLVLQGVTGVNADARILQGSNGLVAVRPVAPGALVVPSYVKLYRVTYETLEGVRTVWVPEGGEVTINASPASDGQLGVRKVFVAWKGDVESTNPVLNLVVEKPIHVRAEYRTLYRVTVESVLGVDEYWVEEGGSLTIFQPPELPGLILGRRLTYYLVNGEPMEPRSGGLLILTGIREPVQVVAVYEPVVLWRNVAVLGGLVVLAVALYAVYDYWATRRAARAEMAARASGGEDEKEGKAKTGVAT